MTRIPLPTDAELTADARELLAQLPPLNIVRMFAGAPAALKPLTDLGQAVLLHGELDARLREIAILAVARTSDSEYERLQHENVSRAIGMTEEDIRAAADARPEDLDEEAAMVWRFGQQIAANVRADEELTERVVAHFGNRQATELVVACATYSAIARIIETCGVQLEEVLPTEGIKAEDWTD